MATQLFTGASTRQQWDETLHAMLNLSSATLKRQDELEARLEELEVELGVWKHAHANCLDIRERDSMAHKAHIAALNRQIADTDLFSKANQSPLVLCVIDATHSIFNPALVVQGHNGGKQTAQALTKAIAQFLHNESAQLAEHFGRLSFWVTIYFNRAQTLEILLSNKMITSPDQLDSFLVGFSQESPRFLIIDVGKEGTEKIRAYLETYARFPQTLRIFFAGYQGQEYGPTFVSLEKNQLLGKLVLVQTCPDPNDPAVTLPILRIDDLFFNHQLLSRIPRKINTTHFTVTKNGGLASPESPPRLTIRQLDPSLVGGVLSVPAAHSELERAIQPLHKQSPPPCNEHYLMTCSKGAACKYAHDYFLSPDQLALLASNAKKAPCNWLKNGLECPYGNRCCWGHVCPNGPKCFHLSKGKCWFKGDGMHPLLTSPPTPTSS